MKTAVFIFIQYLIPQHTLSRLIGYLAASRIVWLKRTFIHWFIKRYHVDMSIAEQPDPDSYANFNDFFTRPLAAGARPITTEQGAIACPADGCISQIGDICNGHIFQAKNHEYSLLELVGGNQNIAKQFIDGTFATIYLSPKDYHRVHMPLAGTLQSMIHIPGDLFSVNDTTADNVPRLFARNERVVTIFETEAGPMAVILVGAMIVASIETPWAGLIAPSHRQIRTTEYQQSANIELAKGEEMGRFKLGSTAIVLFGKDAALWDEQLHHQSTVVMGERIGTLENVCD